MTDASPPTDAVSDAQLAEMASILEDMGRLMMPNLTGATCRNIAVALRELQRRRPSPEPSSPQALVCALKHADSIVGESSDALALRLLAEEVRRLSAEPGWKPPPNTPEEFAILRKCITAVEYIDEGSPLKDVMDKADIEAAIRLLLKFEQQLTDMVCGGPMGSPPPTKAGSPS